MNKELGSTALDMLATEAKTDQIVPDALRAIMGSSVVCDYIVGTGLDALETLGVIVNGRLIDTKGCGACVTQYLGWLASFGQRTGAEIKGIRSDWHDARLTMVSTRLIKTLIQSAEENPDLVGRLLQAKHTISMRTDPIINYVGYPHNTTYSRRRSNQIFPLDTPVNLVVLSG